MSDLTRLKADFYSAVDAGDMAGAHEVAGRLMELTDGEEQARWRDWRDLTMPGRRVVMKTCEVDLMVGDELRAVEELREEMQDETLIERLGEEG